MPNTQEEIQESIQQARDYFDQGRVAVADLACQMLISHGVIAPELILLLGQVAGALGEYGTARRLIQHSAALDPDRAAQAIAEVERLEGVQKFTDPTIGSKQRFHLIKAWGFGFTADLDHTLGHLLAAEMAGRIPVIHWGQNSLFRDPTVENAWNQFFEPVSPFSIADLCREDYSFYPGKWSARNLRSEDLNKWEGVDSKTPGVTFLHQPAVVTVGDFFTSPLELIPWFVARHPLYQPAPISGDDIEQIYRYLIQKYLKPKPWITTAVARFAFENFRFRKLQAVHVRGSDKVTETPEIADLRQQVFNAVQADLLADPSLYIFY